MGFLAGQWEYYLKLYFGTGVSPCYRGHRLYNPAHPEGATLVKQYTDWNMQYRVILHADIIHLKRADGHGVDAILHVQPDPAKSKERAMLIVFNQSPHTSANMTLRVPLYYSGQSVRSPPGKGVIVCERTTRGRCPFLTCCVDRSRLDDLCISRGSRAGDNGIGSGLERSSAGCHASSLNHLVVIRIVVTGLLDQRP